MSTERALHYNGISAEAGMAVNIKQLIKKR